MAEDFLGSSSVHVYACTYYLSIFGTCALRSRLSVSGETYSGERH